MYDYWGSKRPKKQIGQGDIARFGESFGNLFGETVSSGFRTTFNPTWKPRKLARPVHFRMDSDHDGVIDHKDCRPFDPHRQDEAPWSDRVIFYADKRNKKIVPIYNEYMGKGWWKHTVGEYSQTTRSKDYHPLLRKHYPSFKDPVSLFTETSYHSSYPDEQGQITNYGTNDYNLQYSSYKPIGTFNLVTPIRTQTQSAFGNIIDTVPMQEWNYIVLDWIPSDPIQLQIQHQKSTPFGDKKEIYKSKKYPISQKDKAIQDFMEYVRRHG